MERNANSRDYSPLYPAILFVGDENEPVIEPFLCPPRTNSVVAMVVEVCALQDVSVKLSSILGTIHI